MVDGEATGASALSEQDLLLDVRIKGELERDRPRENLTGVGDERCRRSWSH